MKQQVSSCSKLTVLLIFRSFAPLAFELGAHLIKELCETIVCLCGNHSPVSVVHYERRCEAQISFTAVLRPQELQLQKGIQMIDAASGFLQCMGREREDADTRGRWCTDL